MVTSHPPPNVRPCGAAITGTLEYLNFIMLSWKNLIAKFISSYSCSAEAIKIAPRFAPAEKCEPSLPITIPLKFFSAKSTALLIPIKTPWPRVFILVLNSRLIIPSPKSFTTESEFSQTICFFSILFKIINESWPGFFTNDLDFKS